MGNTITIDTCTSTQVVFENALALCETVNSKKCKVQVKGECPTISIDKCDGFTVYLSWAAVKNTTISQAKSSEMNVSYPTAEGEDAEYVEKPIPEQFVPR